jgi:H+/Cl- antiporter ClcA
MIQPEEAQPIAQGDYIRLLLWTIVIAIPIAALTVVYVWMIHHGAEIYRQIPALIGVPAWLFTLLIAVTGGLLVGLGLRFLGERSEESEGLAGQISAGQAKYKGMAILLGIALIGILSGASVGPEGPLGHAGAGIGAWLADKRRYNREQSRLLSLGGVAAVFGAFLGTPMSSALMTLEFTRQLTVPIYANLIVTTVASLFGAMVMFLIIHASPGGTGSYPIEGTFTPTSILWAVVLGLVGLAWAFLFKIIFQSTQRLTRPLDRFPVLKPMFGGLAFGLVGAWMPLTLFSGQFEFESILEHGAQLGIGVLLLLAVLKLFTLSISLSTGFPGGFVFPVFFSSGALGYAIHLLFPIIPLPVSVVGTLAGVGGGVMRMPFAIILLLGVISSPALLPVSVISALTSFMTATMLDAGSARRAMEESQAEMRETYAAEKWTTSEDEAPPGEQKP